ncbi:hypothetical protein Tco_0132654 [Tanacetum coccineum]
MLSFHKNNVYRLEVAILIENQFHSLWIHISRLFGCSLLLTPFYPAFLITASMCPKLPGQQFVDPPFEEEILTFIRELGYSKNIKLLSDVKVDILPQPWRTFGTIINKCLSGVILPDNLTTQVMKESEAYKTYYAFATGKAIPKPKYVRRTTKEKTVQAPKASSGKRIKSVAKVTRSGKKKQLLEGLDTLSEIALSVAEQMKLAIERSKTQLYSSQPSGSGAHKGTGVTPGVPDVPTYGFDDEQISWKSSDEEDDDDDESNIGKDEDDDDQEDNDDKDNDNDQGDGDERIDSDNDGDDFVHPKFSTHDEEDKEEDRFDHRVQTPSHVESTNDEDSDEEIQGANVEKDKQDKEETNEEVKANELYRDVKSIWSTIESFCVIWLYVSVTAFAEPPLLSIITTPPPPTPLITHLQQTPAPTPVTVPSSSIQDLPNFGSLFGFDHRLKTMETNFLEFKQTNQFATTVSSIPGIIDLYLANRMNDTVKIAIQLQSKRLREKAQAENQDFIKKIDDVSNDQIEAEVLIRSSNESKTSHVVAAILSELELKKILIDKMESNKSFHRSDEQKNLYKALVDAYKSDKLILDTYEDTVSFKRHRDDEDKDAEPSDGSNQGPREEELEKNQSLPVHQRKRPSRQLASQLKGPNLITTKPPTPDRDWNKTLPDAHGPVQPWLSSLAQIEDPRELFNELMDTPLDFSAFVMNRLKVNTLTPELLTGPTFKLMKGSCKSLVELEYLFEEVYKATTDQLDWKNPEGQQYPHDLRKPLPLIPNSRGRRVIPFDHFINNDLEYLSGGVSSRKYTTSVTKTKAADYGHIKWIENLVPNRMESARDVYSKRRSIAVTKLQIVEWHNYKHLDWITVRRDDDKLYKFKEGDLKRLRIQDIEDMLLLLVHGKLTNLPVEERIAFNVSLRISDLKQMEAYFTYSNPKGFIYQIKDKKNRLMRIDELHMFSDGTLNDVQTALNDRLKGIRMQYLPQTI